MTRPAGKFAKLASLVCVIALVLSGCSYVVERSNAGIGVLEDSAPPVGAIARGGKYVGWGLGTPAVLALTPVALLLWATPWVDLPLAVDLASAPSLGLGYVVQALVGFPARVAATPWRDGRGDEARASARDGDPARSVPWGFVAEHRPSSSAPRPAAALPAEVEAYYSVLDEDVDRLRENIETVRRDARSAEAAVSVPLGRDRPSTLELYLARGAADGRRRSLVLMTPPSKAAFAARYLARWLARRDFHAAVIVPERSFLEPHWSAIELEASLRQAAIDARTALRALAALRDVDPARLDYLGVSAGAIFGAGLIAVEPSIRRAVLILTGGNLPRILARSDESSVKAYRATWKRRGLDAEALVDALAGDLRSEPARLAAFIDPRRVLLFLGARDTRVPTESGLALWRALGEPELYLLAGNHETASLCFGFILRRSERFLREGR